MTEIKSNPTVSVIIPTYNRAHLIGRAIQSVLYQTYQDFEIIVVDDASTDNTEEVVSNFDDERIRYIRLKENSGTSAAPRNTAIRIARGEYIAFQDSDDEWLPEKLEKQMRLFEIQPLEVGVVYAGFWKILGHRKIYIPSPGITRKEGNIHDSLLAQNFVAAPAAVVRKECFRKVGGFDEELPTLMDWELWIRISRCYQFQCVDEPLMISYYTIGGINEPNLSVKIQTLKLILGKHFEDIKKKKKTLAEHYFSIGSNLCLQGDLKVGREYILKAVRTYPFNIKYIFGSRIYNGIRKIKRLIMPTGK